MDETSPQKIIGIYHKNCLDGTTAAAVLLKRFPTVRLYSLVRWYTPEEFNLILQDVDKETTVYIVDFGLNKADAVKLAEQAREIINIDHHIGTKEEIEEFAKSRDNFTFVFDNDRAGGSLSWIHFFGKESMPKFVQLAEQIDLFKFSQDNEAHSLAANAVFLMNKPEVVKEFFDTDITPLLEKGAAIQEFQNALVEEFLASAEPTMLSIGGKLVRAYNAPVFLRSEIGHRLSKQFSEAVVIFRFMGDGVRLSFRGNDTDNPSAMELAEALGGTGHRNAAGAFASIETFVGMVVHK